jgi:hypothetical protein
VLGVLWNTVPARPLRVLVVLVHEIFHALTALLTGGGVQTIEVLSYQVGLTSLYGGLPVLVYSAGYLGTALLGSLLLGSGPHYPMKRFLYLGLGLLVLANTLILVRTPFGWAYGLVAGFFFITLFFKEFRFSAYITDFVGILCLVDVFHDLIEFAVYPSRNDALILSEITGLSYAAVLSAWGLIAVALAAAAAYVAWRNLAPAQVERKLEWGEFRFVTREFVERSTRMRLDDSYRRKSRITIIVYLSIFGAVLLLVIWASRFVLFQPWTAREWATAAAADGRIFLFGGRDRSGQNYGEIYRIDPQRLRIHQINSLPTPRFGMGAVSHGGKIYLLGGFDGRTVYDDLLELDPETMAIRLAGRLPGRRTFGGVATEGGSVYYAGGWDGNRQCDEIFRVELPTGDCRLMGRLPSPREFVGAAMFRGKIYVCGGTDSHGGYLDEILEIDPEGGMVLRTARLPSSRIRFSALALEDRILLIGGWEGKKVPEVLSLEPGPEGIACRVFFRLPQGLSDFGAVAVGDQIYLIGGTHERFHRQIGFLRWDPESGMVESLKFRSFLFW